MRQIPIHSSAQDIQDVFSSGGVPVFELTEEKSLDELMSEFGWVRQEKPEAMPEGEDDVARVNPFGDPAGAW